MRRLVVTACAVLVLAAGCGGGGDESSDEPTASPTPTTTAAPEALSGLQCADAGDGTLTVTGVITNSGDEPADYTVAVYVGPADGAERRATEQVLESVQPDGSTPVEITGVAPQGDPATCHVRVLRSEPKA